MNHEQWLAVVKQLSVGKILPKAVYVHRNALEQESPTLANFINDQASSAGLEDEDWNIARLHKDVFKVTLLNYPTFYDEAYPALHGSTGIDLRNNKAKTTDFSCSANPPILHRKENMILASDPAYEDFCEITREGEQAGLYDNTRIIGFKQSWEILIQDKGYELLDGRLFRQASFCEDSSNHKVDRHKTALSRDTLSSPLKTLAQNGYLEGQYSLFDYGCGHGDDITELSAHGLIASGWDPNWRPDGVKVEGDLVNLGYVINVIENLQERVEAVQGAWELTRKLLVVSAMIASERHISKFKPFKDGVLTSRNTFQKYYSQAELQIFLEQILDEEPIPISPGIFYIFKDKDEEQLYLANKQRRRTRWKQLVHKSVRIPKKQQLLTDNRELFECFWKRALELGRIPALDEFEDSHTLQKVIGSPHKTFNLLRDEFDTSELEHAEQERREDLLVYFALQLFNKKRVYKHMPEQLKRDIKAFFGDYKTALSEAKELLFSLAEPELIHNTCEQAHKELPASIFNDSHSLVLHSKFINDLPPALRVYVGCASQLFSDTDGVDLVKIHIRSGKLTMMIYEGFETQPIPVLRERIKINMRTRQVNFSDYGYGDSEPQPLYWKSQQIDESFPDYNKQCSFDKRLAELELPGMVGYGLSPDDFEAILRNSYKLQIKGYRFYQA
ncbi:DNA phosphorothioation-associated putative methyltransferase [Sansalvadorimonas sp. 2012CJ34-2]|uniref:DNA phosphorothioation-associated putative methyltransferase n=1 Tax=Parendozoicomonas callyspongiae TaxID=2942213 RepID=A0ABT0PLI8_9GAMM|nr:DNA phosphorothioation-associated putative methyltransferase [Sansalvadorimonas sp. 2012CJ34-2]MCL6272213.1 DNA phosphorothioation-associated putative methyltransferase [Sansalvadorimonas sp. 2012CJ34-2]